jgi:REP element-mobilizing transposase RayT
VSHVRRLRFSDRVFFLSVNLRPRIKHFSHSEFPLLIGVLEASRRRLKFLLCGYVLMPDHWHARVATTRRTMSAPPTGSHIF